ncbi:ArsR/SmtB family transcription factor [Nonomuraea endophytica]|uniref:DNA-binding transcriptional ArsR family regulator n=1 Tax=Nonomuraea endophytica TaxID=714136 RepID=A0A7W8EJD2_9ACTN|nr:metalloregulator ArsR/SmtB family transcription factor [Nonomuraea endophytica]MBB5081534.1 DNA-binding transcriptional ArsR family regulator [Nonomuraea endophytica]
MTQHTATRDTAPGAPGPEASGAARCPADGTVPGQDGQDGQEVAELSPAVHAFLKALASPARQRVMLLFARGAELTVGQVAEATGLAQPRASEQLAELRRGGILTSRKDGKTVLHRADKRASAAALAELQAYLQHCC